MATYNNKNYGNRKVYVANTGAATVGANSYSTPKKPKFETMKKKEKESPVPKVLMTVEVLLIVLCILGPSIIGRKDRANKKIDLETADYLGSQVEKGLAADDTLNEYAKKGAQLIRFNNSDGSDITMYYRILGYMEADNDTPDYYYVCQSVGITHLDTIGNMGMRSKIKNWGEEYDLSMKFNAGEYLNQWIIAIDRDDNIHIFAGGGVTQDTYYISKNHTLKGAHNNRVYEDYPSVDMSYRFLLSDTMTGWKY